MPSHIALAGLRPLEEFVRDPFLTVACVLLIAVSIAWLVVSRLIYANLRRAAVKEQAALRARRSRGGQPSRRAAH
jgi:cell division protein FtsX